MQAHRFILRAGVCAVLALVLGAQAQVARIAPGTTPANKTVNPQQAATFGLPRPGGLSSPMPNSLTAGSTAVNTAGSATTATTTSASATPQSTTATTTGTDMTGTVGTTDAVATSSGVVTTGGTLAGGVATPVATGAYSATAVMGAGAGTNLPAPRQGGSMGPGPYTAVELAGSFLNADANGDGELSRAEATRLAIMPFAFEEMDANHDGVVTRSEYETSLTR